MDPLLEAECICAVLGIQRALAPKMRAPSESELRRARKLKDVIKRRVSELLDLAKPKSQAGPPELPDYRDTNDALTKKINEDSLVDVVVSIPEEFRPGCVMTWFRGVEYLSSRFPRRIEQRLTGPYLHDPSDGEWAEFGWLWRVANQPLFILDLAGEGMLIGVEVQHLGAIYPAIYAELCGCIFDALSDRVAADKEWMAPWWLQKQLCTILGVSPVSATLVQDIEGALQRSQAETKTRTGALKVTQQGETTAQGLAVSK